MRALLLSVGSRGDIQPMLVLAHALQRSGHSVCLAAPPNFREFIEARGIQFYSVGADTEALILENRALAERAPLLSIPSLFGLLRRETERQLRDTLAFPEAVDLVVAAGVAFGGHALAERRNVPYVYVSYTLHGILDDVHPPAAAPLFGLPRLGNRALWSGIMGAFDGTLRGAFRRARQSHGLAPDPTPWRHVHATRTLLAQDALIGTLSDRARRFAEQIPALVVDDDALNESLPAPVEAFLQQAEASGEPVVYVGFGSMPSVKRARVLRAVVEFQRETQTRVLLFSPRNEERDVVLPPEILPVGGLDHTRLFPRVDFIVHHGGAGTVATALRSGVPQLVVPHVVDQFFHGKRVAALGLGPEPIPKAKLDAPGLIGAFRASRASVEAARGVRALLQGSSGSAAAVHYLERLLNA